MKYQVTNRRTQEITVFENWAALDQAGIDVREYTRPVEVQEHTPIAVISKVFINPTLWVKDFEIWSDRQLVGLQVNNSCFHFMKPEQEI